MNDTTIIVEEIIKHLAGKHEQSGHGRSRKAMQNLSPQAKRKLEKKLSIVYGAPVRIAQTSSHPQDPDLRMINEVGAKFAGGTYNVKTGMIHLGGDFHVDDIDSEVAKYISEKHLPGQHDQMEHGKSIRGAMATMPKNWRDAGKIRASVVSELTRLSKAGLSSDLKKQIIDHAAVLSAPGATHDLPKFAPLLKQAWDLSKQADMQLAGKEQKKVAPAERLKQVVGEAETGKKESATADRLKEMVAGAGGKAEMPPRKAAPKKDYKAAANTWMASIGQKVAKVANALKQFGMRWINAKIRSASQRAEFKKQYGQWAGTQASADKLYGLMKVEAQKSKGLKVPTRKFYELARQWKTQQTRADYNKSRFFTLANIPQEAMKSQSDPALVDLESPYED